MAVHICQKKKVKEDSSQKKSHQDLKKYLEKGIGKNRPPGMIYEPIRPRKGGQHARQRRKVIEEKVNKH